MTDEMRRREFLHRVGSAAAGGALVPVAWAAESTPTADKAPVRTIKDLPTRRLGRVGIDVPLLSIGLAPMGHGFFEPEPFERVTHAAIDAGIRYLDVAPVYDVAEDRLEPILAKRRKEVFLVTKVWAKTRDDALRSVEQSLQRMGVEHVDLLHLHNVGQYTTEQALGKGGLLEGVLEAKKRGWTRHVGCTGHLRPRRLIPVIETGEMEVVMAPMNFVDCHTYDFEKKLIPVARKHKCAVVPMKVFGGLPSVWGGYKKREPGRLAGEAYHQWAIDYALSVPGVSTIVLGMKSLAELRQAIEAVRRHRPLEGERRAEILTRGAELAKEWGPRFGPVA